MVHLAHHGWKWRLVKWFISQESTEKPRALKKKNLAIPLKCQPLDSSQIICFVLCFLHFMAFAKLTNQETKLARMRDRLLYGLKSWPPWAIPTWNWVRVIASWKGIHDNGCIAEACPWKRKVDGCDQKKQCNAFQCTKDFDRSGEQQVWVVLSGFHREMEKNKKKYIYIYIYMYILCGAFNKRTVKFFGFTKDFGIRKNLCVMVTVAVSPCKFSLWASREISTEGMSTVLPDRGP